MQAYRCDRCKRFYDAPPEHINVAVTEEEGTRILDLCPRCHAELENWIMCRPLRSKAKPTTADPKIDPEINGGFVFGG